MVLPIFFDLAGNILHGIQHAMTQGPGRDTPVVLEGLAHDGRKVSATEGTSPYLSLTAPKRVTSPSAAEILKVCKERSLVETAKLLFEARTHLAECKHQEVVEGSSRQISRMVMLPNKGTAYFKSDIEGHEYLAHLIDSERFIERWQKNEPDDQVYLCVLGDIVDRSTSSSSLVDLLLELKVRYGLSRSIAIVAGNHELTPSLQKEDEHGLYYEITRGRHFPLLNEEVDDPITQELIEISISAKMRDINTRVTLPSNPSGRLQFAREGLWHLYNEVFSLLPTSIVTPHGAYAAHGGFPVRGSFEAVYAAETRSEDDTNHHLIELACYADKPSSDGRQQESPPDGIQSEAVRTTIADITWSDFNPALDDSESSDMFGPNWERGKDGKPGPGVAFGLKGFEKFASLGNFTLFLRGHQARAPRHPSVQMRTSTAWSCGPILTIANGMRGGCAVLDLSIKNPTPDSVSLVEIQERVELEF